MAGKRGGGPAARPRRTRRPPDRQAPARPPRGSSAQRAPGPVALGLLACLASASSRWRASHHSGMASGAIRAAMFRYRAMPVPAGISLPMITFSFRPSSGSDLALMAASVSTRVVSWKEAAASHESVASEALVIPIRIGPGRGRLAAGLHDLGVRLLEPLAVHQLAGQEVGVAWLDDVHLAEHLPNDQLDVLVVDGHALGAVDLLDLLDEEHLQGLHALHTQLLVRVHRTLGQLLADLHGLAVGDGQPGPERDLVLDLVPVLRRDRDPAAPSSPRRPRS